MATLGQSIPPDTPHAVSVSLPTWKANVGYEEDEKWVTDQMTTGYPRFFINKAILSFAQRILTDYGRSEQGILLFPSRAAATRCLDFIQTQAPTCDQGQMRCLDFSLEMSRVAIISAAMFPKEHQTIAKQFWQHTGEGISSRQAEFCHKALDEGHLRIQNKNDESAVSLVSEITGKGPRRYQKTAVTCHSRAAERGDTPDTLDFVEERFGRNLDMTLAVEAKKAIRKRIARALTSSADLPAALQLSHRSLRLPPESGFSEDDVYLFSCGMNAIYYSYQMAMAGRNAMKGICYGFPYTDTLKVLKKFGPGCIMYGFGTEAEIDELERRCLNGERFSALFCEFPGNPLLKTPNLKRIKSLAERFGFILVVDETIGNFINVHVLPHADIVVSSLTKVFTGECNVMGGSLVLNPQSQHYSMLKNLMSREYKDEYWPQDAIFMERNSRDFISRVHRINKNAEMISDCLSKFPTVKAVYYPKSSSSRANYDFCRNKDGGYGGLLSVTFHNTSQAIAFFDNLDTAKGPSLGTNFTLTSPYVLLAHYRELEWAAKFGVEADLIRISVGLEEPADLILRIEKALEASTKVRPKAHG